MAAQAAERGGADLLVALNAGRLRSMGAPSAACQLALRDANSLVMEFARSEILTRTSLPVFFGATTFGVDDLSQLVNSISEAGFHGVANFPGSVFLDGQFRRFLEESGLGFDREIALLRAARHRGLATLAYVYTIDEARRAAGAGVDIVNITFGWNKGGALGVKSAPGLEDAAMLAAEFVRAVRAIDGDVRCVIEGGPIVTPEQMDYVCRVASADGYVGGSTIDRVPLESAIEMATTAFRTVGALRKQVDALERQLNRKVAIDALIGISEPMSRARDQVAHAMESDLPVLIVGEPGSGRSEVAAAIHHATIGAHRMLVAPSCKPTRAEETELSLFGCVGGAFPGVEKDRTGWLELALGSSLVLDDVGELDPGIQRQILQAVRAGAFWPRGGTSLHQLDLRFIGISRFDPMRASDAGRFDPGFAHWMSTIRVDLPPLRERLEDIPLLAKATLRRAAGGSHTEVEPSAYRVLLGHHWPGNLRELRSVLQRAVWAARDCTVTAQDLQPLLQAHTAASAPRESFMSERDWILDGLRRNRFRREETARFLRISRKTLYNKMQHYGLLHADPPPAGGAGPSDLRGRPI
jgi:predicted TIM-barrel enzyme/DNA-binding NtrC family response regulator